MKAVIMAGGEGTRLRPITLTRPKPLVPVAGETCIDFVINGLVRAGVSEIIITTGYRFQEILIKRQFTANIRKSKGQDIAAACGQLSGGAAE